MVYYTSDLHFCCENSYEGRTLETDKLIVDNWNKKVTNGDDVYILGDVAYFGTKLNAYACSMISQLKGKKHLILGNHDGKGIKDTRVAQLFTEIVPYKEILDYVDGTTYRLALSHYPQMFWNGQHKGWIHLYGHLHTSKENDLYNEYLRKTNEYFEYERIINERTDCPPIKAYNVGCMLWNYEPVTLKEILEHDI